MRKLFVLIIVGLAFFLIPKSTSAQTLDPNQEQEILNRLRTTCYEPAKSQSEAKLGSLATSALDSLDFSQLPEFAEIFGELQELKETIKAGIPEKANLARDDFKVLGQINVNLASCYERETASYPALLAKAQTLSAEAKKQLSEIENFDYNKLFETNRTAASLITIPAKTRKVIRLRTFCLDSDRPAPSAGEQYFLATVTTETLKKGLCDALKTVQTGNLTEIQNNIWQGKVESQQPQPTITSNQKIRAWGLTGFGVLSFLLTLVWGIAKITTFSPLGKILWPVGLIITLGLSSWGGWRVMTLGLLPFGTKSTIQKITSNSLIKSYQDSEIFVEAFSPGTITDLDLIITNRTNKTKELDTACVFFVPGKSKTETKGDQETGQTPTIEIVRSQRLASAGSTGDGPPYPELPPTPEELMEQIKRRAEENLQKSIEEFKKNPNEETLKDVLDELSDCQQVGCNQGNAQEEIAKGWQSELDRRTQEYKDNSTEENRGKLLEATELGQAVGADTSAAEAALGY